MPPYSSNAVPPNRQTRGLIAPTGQEPQGGDKRRIWEDDPILPKCITTAFMERIRMSSALFAMLHGFPLMLLCLESREIGCFAHSRHRSSSPGLNVALHLSQMWPSRLWEGLVSQFQNDRMGPPVWSVNPASRRHGPRILLLNPRGLPDELQNRLGSE